MGTGLLPNVGNGRFYIGRYFHIKTKTSGYLCQFLWRGGTWVARLGHHSVMGQRQQRAHNTTQIFIGRCP